MPLQNRVDPFGRILATAARGTLTGNRGIIHNESRQIVRSHATKAWITCLLDWKGARRAVMTGRKWTELFFLDEATALAAGHRPCGYCRRADYERFVDAWSRGNPELAPSTGRRAPVIDAVLHEERRNEQGRKHTYPALAAELPVGTMYADDSGQRWLAIEKSLARPWSFEGYGPPAARPLDRVAVLTPRSTVRAIAAGYTLSRVDL